MATLIEPGVRYTFGPIVFTGKGPLLSSASSIRKVRILHCHGSPVLRVIISINHCCPVNSGFQDGN